MPVVNIVLILELFNIGVKSFGMAFLIDASLEEVMLHSFITSNRAI